MTLTQHDTDLWSAEHVFGWPLPVTPIPVRMTVIRLGDGGLILHSPIPVTAELRGELERLGPVAFIVVPAMHGKYAEDAARAWPAAQLLAAPKPPKGRESLPFAGVVADEAPAAWAGAVETQLVRGFRLNEVVLFHRPSRTLVLTDLCFNIQRSESLLARAFFRLDGMWKYFGPSYVIRWLGVSDRKALRESLERIARWPFQRIVPGHGDTLENAGPEALRAAWMK